MRGIFFGVFRLRPRHLVTAFLAGIFIVLVFSLAAGYGESSFVPTSSQAIVGSTIVIDPGHGGEDPGAIENGVVEKDIDLAVSRCLKKVLEQSGAKVYLTRNSDRDLGGKSPELENRKMKDLDNRIGLAHKVNARLFVSVHANSFPGPDSRGAQVFYQNGQAESKKLAEAIQTEMVRLLQNTDREALSADIYTNRMTKMPSVTVEIGFLSCPEEASLLKKPGYQQKMAYAITSGIARYLAGKQGTQRK